MLDEYRAGFLYSFKVLFHTPSWFIRPIKFYIKFSPRQNFKTFLECSHPKYIFDPRWWFVRDSIVAPLVFQFESIYFQQLKIFLKMPRFLFHFVLQKRRFHHSKRKRRNEFETGSLAEVLSSDANEYQNWKKCWHKVDKNCWHRKMFELTKEQDLKWLFCYQNQDIPRLRRRQIRWCLELDDLNTGLYLGPFWLRIDKLFYFTW